MDGSKTFWFFIFKTPYKYKILCNKHILGQLLSSVNGPATDGFIPEVFIPEVQGATVRVAFSKSSRRRSYWWSSEHSRNRCFKFWERKIVKVVLLYKIFQYKNIPVKPKSHGKAKHIHNSIEVQQLLLQPCFSEASGVNHRKGFGRD